MSELVDGRYKLIARDDGSSSSSVNQNRITLNDLLAHVIEAHGGLDRWNQFNSVTATIVTGGGLWALKGVVQDPNPREMTGALHAERASVLPFGQPDWRTAFTLDRIAIETTSGTIVRERADPRASFARHTMNTHWDLLHRAYFNGYSMWTYLTTPFLMAMPGFEVTEISPWQEVTNSGVACALGFPTTPPAIAKNRTSTSPTICCCAGHDYHVDFAGGLPAAQYGHGIVEVHGLSRSDQPACLCAWARSAADPRPVDGLDRSQRLSVQLKGGGHDAGEALYRPAVAAARGRRMLTGKGRYVDDIQVPGMLHVAILRLPHAHAVITTVDMSAAQTSRRAPRPVGSGSPGQDGLDRAELGNTRHVGPGPASGGRGSRPLRGRMRRPGCRRHTRGRLRRARPDRRQVETLPAVVDEEEAIRDGAPQLHNNVRNNITTRYKVGGGDYAKAARRADQVLAFAWSTTV